jgi:hypothetical protein
LKREFELPSAGPQSAEHIKGEFPDKKKLNAAFCAMNTKNDDMQ